MREQSLQFLGNDGEWSAATRLWLEALGVSGHLNETDLSENNNRIDLT